MKGKLMILLITAIFFIPFLIEIINLKMLDILKNIIECLKVKKNGIFKFSFFKISYYIILPVVVPILIIYCILISFVLLMISIILFFTKNEVLVYILFSFGIHFFSVFVYLFHTSVQILKMSVK